MEVISHLAHRLLGSVGNVAIFGLCILLSSLFIIPIQRIYFHPLSKYPGPKLWAISRLPFAFHHVRGKIHLELEKLHAEYGNVVRVAPAELSYINEEAWSDIYQPNKYTRQQLARDGKVIPDPPDGGPHGIIFTTNEDDHARMRRNFNPMFTESAMRAQEPLMKVYFDLLIRRLHERCEEPLDITKWLNYVTFDIIGDLTFGESFDCLQKSELHSWLRSTFEWIKLLGIMGMAMKLSPLDKILGFFVPKSLVKATMEHREYSNTKLSRRLDHTDARQDFLSYAQKHLDSPTGMSMGELRETVQVLILAGSETSATSLDGQVYYLAMNPNPYSKLKDEIRGKFKNEDEISIKSVSELPYTMAVINESLRLFPPVATTVTLNRVTPPEGSTINNEFVAGNTIVAIQQWVAFRSPVNFTDPEDFVPERWLPEGMEGRYKGDKLKVVQPFGIGPRGCIGKSLALAEMKVILARLVWNFDWELENGRFDWPGTMKVYGVWDKTPLMIRLKPVKGKA